MCGPKGGRMGWSRWTLFLGVSLKAWLFLGVFRAGSFIFPHLRSPTFGAATALLLALCRSRRFRPGGHRPSRVSGVPISSVDSSTSCTAAATSSSAAPALPVGRATLLSAGSGSCTGSAGRERLGTTGSLLGVSAGTFRRDGARFRDKVLLSGCWVSCCRAWLRRFWFTNSVHVTVAFELSPAVCTPSDFGWDP